MRGATKTRFVPLCLGHFYSHAPCGARLKLLDITLNPTPISTHTPLAGRDPLPFWYGGLAKPFLLTRPLRGATLAAAQPCFQDDKFLLTRPLRGATILPPRVLKTSVFLLTRPLRGATRAIIFFVFVHHNFYSHAPCGARQWKFRPSIFDGNISTHTPLAGRDNKPKENPMDGFNFYSHAPCGARPVCRGRSPHLHRFLLTRPLRGATIWGQKGKR